MNKFHSFGLGHIYKGHSYAFIYMIISKKFKTAYIGQTNEKGGVLGRINSHLKENGTFRTHFEDKIGFSIDEIEDLSILSYNLGSEKIYTSLESSFREGVEYLVKKHLCEQFSKNDIFIRILGYTRSNSTTSLNEINNLSNDISNFFVEHTMKM